MFCKKGVLRNFTKFSGKHLCQSLYFNNVAAEHLWRLLLNVTILFNQIKDVSNQSKIKKVFNISINILIIYKEDKKRFSINILIKFLTLHAFQILIYTW